MIGLFVLALALAVAIRVPETVASPFMIVPVRGTDPVRAPHGGVVKKVAFQGAEPVAKGDTLFVIQSSPIGDRSSELAALDTELGGSRAKIENARRQYQSQRRADESEIEKLSERVIELGRIISFKKRQYALAIELVSRYAKLREEGYSSPAESIRHELEANRIAAELRESDLERAEAEASISKLRHEISMRATQHDELERRERERITKTEIRVATLRRELGDTGRTDLEVVAPCSGVVLRSRAKAPGAVAVEGGVLCEIACDGEALEAELEVPPYGAGRLRAGQVVKLLYDAYPYQRYGARYGKLRWVSPAAVKNSDRTVFRALVDLDDDGIWVDGTRRRFLAGMGGTARIVIGRRSLLAYAFEPIRQLRESLSPGPSG